MNTTLLSRLVSYNSVYPNELRLGKFMREYLTGLGLKVFIQPVRGSGFNLFASRGNNPGILFYGHLDTAPTLQTVGWRTHPLTLTPRAGKLYGLGALDMKGGIFAFLQAVGSTATPVKIFLSVDEENISAGAWIAVSKKAAFFRNLDLIISAEPNFGLGDHSVTVGRTGRYVFQITFEGKSAHIINQSSGCDAIAAAAGFINDFYRLKSDLFQSPETVSQVRAVSAESQGMSVCDLARIQVEVLSGVHDTQDSITAKLRSMSGARVDLVPRATPYLPGYKFSGFAYRDMIARIIRQYTGRNIRLTLRSSVADDNVLATLGIPVITWGPSGGQAHAANEFVSVKSLEKFIHMYTDLLNGVKC